MRTPRETCELIEATITEINEQRDNSQPINDKLIADVCSKNQINEAQIRKVAGWKKQYVGRISGEELTRIREAKALLKKHKIYAV